MDIQEEVMEQIAQDLALDFFVRCLRLPDGVTVIDEAREEAKKIVNHPEILIKDPNQNLTEVPLKYYKYRQVWFEAQAELRDKANWVKAIKEEKSNE